MKKAYYIMIILITLPGYCYAQAPTFLNPQMILPEVPTVAVPNPFVKPYNQNTPKNISNFNQSTEQKVLMQKTQRYQKQLQTALNSEDMNYIQKEIQRQTDIMMLTKYGFPSQSEYKGTSAFYSAFDEISNMLNGSQKLNLGRVIFLVENAWHNNKIDYNDYKNAINKSVNFCNQKIKEEELNIDNNLVKNMMLFRFITDTLELKDKVTKKKQIHYPIKYNYDDYDSHLSYDSHFVTTLMQTSIGQCHSIPLFYLVLAEKIGAEAYWSFSPRHSFVKIQDEKGKWYNLELTCKAILSDTHYMNSSYIKAEALQSKIYLEPMDKTNVIAEMLLELARSYYQKYGYDDFYLKCINTAERNLKNDLNAKLLKSAYQTQLTLTLAYLLNAPKPEIMKQLSLEAYKHYEKMLAQYKEIDNMGYEEIPIAIYALWLNHIAKEKDKLEKDKLPSKFTKINISGK